MVSNGYWSSMCTQLSRSIFSFFFFYMRIGNLEPSCKFQRALRPKEEDRRGLDKLSRRGAATNGFSFFGSFIDAKNGKSLLLLCHYARFRVYVVIVVVIVIGRCTFRPNVTIVMGKRGFLLQ